MSDTRFLVSARKYRPQTFDDLVGQAHVSETLRNAVGLDRLAHAYLFSGPRGVGKTTAARLLAKAINCEADLSQRDKAEPCRTCNSCVAFEQGRSMNVIELDAASNNKVDDIRALRDNVIIPPQGAKRKVYIVDEVHMLSTAAFNAFLKTLEEPPVHALFIFATTEPHKVLPTILSRCQRFDFRRITIEDTVEHLKGICASEGITADESSLHLIARKGDGALRDALSLFDQAVALCGTSLQYDELTKALGVVDRDLFFSVTDLALAHDSAGLLRLVDDVVRRGYDLAEFTAGLIEHLRNLYVAVSTNDPNLILADSVSSARYIESRKNFAEADLLRAMMILEETGQSFRQNNQPRLALELALIKLAHLNPAADLAALLAKLEAGIPQAPAQPVPQSTGEPRPPYRGTPPAADSSDDPPPPKPAPPPAPRSAPEAAPPPPLQAESSPGTSSLFGVPALKKPSRPSPENSGDGHAGAPPVPMNDFDVPLGKIQDEWNHIVKRVSEKSRAVSSILNQCEAERVHNGAVVVAVPNKLAADMLNSNLPLLREALQNVLNVEPPQLSFVINSEMAETLTETDPYETIKQLRQTHPTLRRLFDTFEAEIDWS